MKKDFTTGQFVPLLEDDIVAYIYYRLVADGLCHASTVHVKTRAAGLPGKKIDIVVGPVKEGIRRRDTRREVEPVYAIEVKFFHTDQNPGERNNLASKIQQDINRMAKVLRTQSGTGCAVVVADEIGHWADSKREPKLAAMQDRARAAEVDFLVVPLSAPEQRERGIKDVAAKQWTRLYKGKKHTLEELPDGKYLLDGKRRCNSLTNAAELLTGYHISGHDFWEGRGR